MEIFKVLALCLVTAVICLVLKQQKSEFALAVSVIACVLILGLIIKNIIVPITVLGGRIESYGINIDYFKTAVKALGIGYVTTFIADSCRDAGQTNLASKAEMAGRCAIFILSVPLILSVMDTALGFIK